jgi:hypothetical protein
MAAIFDAAAQRRIAGAAAPGNYGGKPIEGGPP